MTLEGAGKQFETLETEGEGDGYTEVPRDEGLKRWRVLGAGGYWRVMVSRFETLETEDDTRGSAG